MTEPIKTNWKPRKPDEYRLFQIWKALPLSFKSPREITGIDTIAQTKAQFENEELKSLIGIGTQKEFAARFKVEESTLSDWNQHPVPDEFKVDWTVWAKDLTKEVMMALANRAMLEGKASEVKLFMQLVDGYVEKTSAEVELAEDTFTMIRDLAEAAKNLPND